MVFSAAYDIQRIPYSLNPPEGWKFREGPGFFVFAAISPESLRVEHPTNPFVFENLTLSQEAADSASMVALRKDGVAFIQGNQLKYYKDGKLGRGTVRAFNGIQGAYVRLIFTNGDGIRLCNTQFSFLDGSVLYSLVLTSRAQDTVRNEKMMEKVLASLKRRTVAAAKP